MSERSPPPDPDPASPPRGGRERKDVGATTRVVKNSLWLIAQPLLMNAISILATAYIARRLGRTEYGRFVFAISFIAMFMPLSNMGLRFLSIRHIATSPPEDVPSYVGRMSVLRVALALAGAALAIVSVSLAKGAPETRHVVYLATCIIALQAVTTTATDVFQAFESMRLVALVNFVSGMTLTVLSVVTLYLGFGLLGLMASYVAGNLLGAVLAVYYLYSRFTVPRMAIDLRFWKASLVAAAPLFIPNLVREAGTRLGVVMLGGMVSQTAVGSFGAASTLVEKAQVIPDGVCSALFPTLTAAAERSREEASALYRRFFRYFLILATPIAVGGTILAQPIISLIYGSKYEESPAVLAIMVWGLFATFFAQLQGWSIAAVRQEKRAFFVPIIATAVYLPAALLLIPRFGEVGLAVAWIGVAAVHFVLFRPIVRAHLSLRSTDPGVLWRVLVANAVMAAATLSVRGWPLVLSIAVGALVYGVATVAVGAVTRSELAEAVARISRRVRRERAAS